MSAKDDLIQLIDEFTFKQATFNDPVGIIMTPHSHVDLLNECRRDNDFSSMYGDHMKFRGIRIYRSHDMRNDTAKYILF